MAGQVAPDVAQSPAGGKGGNHGGHLVRRAGDCSTRLFALHDVAEPAEQIAGLDQRPEQDQRQQREAAFAGDQAHQIPLGVEAGEGRQAGQHADEGDESENQQRAVAQCGPSADAAPGEQAGEPEQAGLGHGMRDEQAEGDERCGVAEDVALAEDDEHQAGLGDGGVAEQTAVIGLRQGQQVGGDEGDDADCGCHREPLRAADQQQLVDRVERCGAGGRREDGGKCRVRRFVDVERPAVGREGFELGNDGDEHQEEGERAAVGQVQRTAGHAVDVQRAAGMVGEDDADQQEDRNHLRDDQVLEAGGQGAVVVGEQDEAGGRDHREFEENEEVEDVARQDDAGERHDGDQQHCHRAAAKREQGVLQIDGGKQAGQVDQQGQRGFGHAHAQIDRERRRGAGGEDFDCRSVGGGEGP